MCPAAAGEGSLGSARAASLSRAPLTYSSYSVRRASYSNKEQPCVARTCRVSDCSPVPMTPIDASQMFVDPRAISYHSSGHSGPEPTCWGERLSAIMGQKLRLHFTSSKNGVAIHRESYSQLYRGILSGRSSTSVWAA